MRFVAILLGIAAVLGAGAARAGCTLDAVANLPVHIEDGRIFLSGSVNGHQLDFLVNPAYRSVMLNAAKRDLEMSSYKLVRTVLGYEKPDPPFGIVNEGPDKVVIDQMTYVVKGSLPDFGVPGSVAMLGADVLDRFDLEFDLADNLIILYRPSGCDGVQEGYWDRHAAAAEMVPGLGQGTNAEPLNAYNFPFVTLRAEVDGQPVRAIIDAGQRHSFLSLTTAHELGADREDMPEIDAMPDLFDGYSHRTWYRDFATVSLGGETISPAWLRVRSFDSAPASKPRTGSLVRDSVLNEAGLVLGADFLISHRVLFSFSQHKVYFTNSGIKPFLGKEI